MRVDLSPVAVLGAVVGWLLAGATLLLGAGTGAGAVKYDMHSPQCQEVLTHTAKEDAYNRAMESNCLSGCIASGTVQQGERCFKSEDCHQNANYSPYYYCCSVARVCKSSGGPGGNSNAGCRGCGFDARDFSQCNCDHEDFPDNWVKCTNEDRYEDCDSSRVIPLPEAPDALPAYTKMTESTDSGVVEDDEVAIWAVCFHNKFRQEAGLQPVSWNAKLAKFAQFWALFAGKNGLPDPHSTGQQRESEVGESNGENMAWFSDTNMDPRMVMRDSVRNWYSEVAHFKYGTCDGKRTGAPTGHFTQVMWHDSTQIGCGVAISGGKFWSVCNYIAPGNMNLHLGIHQTFPQENFCRLNANPETISKYNGPVPQCGGEDPIDCTSLLNDDGGTDQQDAQPADPTTEQPADPTTEQPGFTEVM